MLRRALESGHYICRNGKNRTEEIFRPHFFILPKENYVAKTNIEFMTQTILSHIIYPAVPDFFL